MGKNIALTESESRDLLDILDTVQKQLSADIAELAAEKGSRFCDTRAICELSKYYKALLRTIGAVKSKIRASFGDKRTKATKTDDFITEYAAHVARVITTDTAPTIAEILQARECGHISTAETMHALAEKELYTEE